MPDGDKSLGLWGICAQNEPKYAETALRQAEAVLRNLDTKLAVEAVDIFRSGPLVPLVRQNLARLARETNNPELLKKAMEGLEESRPDDGTAVVGGGARVGGRSSATASAGAGAQ